MPTSLTLVSSLGANDASLGDEILFFPRKLFLPRLNVRSVRIRVSFRLPKSSKPSGAGTFISASSTD